jgi:hypothetical protein
MESRYPVIDVERAIASVGLFLIVAVAALANHGYEVRGTFTGRVSGFLARRAIDVVAVVGALADHLLPPPTSNGGM